MAEELPSISFLVFFVSTRLFEEETKASEKKTARLDPGSKSSQGSTKSKMQTTAVLQFQQWPTIQCNPILVLSDDDD